MGHGRNGEAVFDGYAVVQRKGLKKRGVFGIHFVLSKINNIDRIGTNRELSRTRSSENTVSEKWNVFRRPFGDTPNNGYQR